MKKITMTGICFSVILVCSPVFAWGSADWEMYNSGFSKETIRVAEIQKSRMEDRPPIEPTKTRWEQFWSNIYHNQPLDSTYPFGLYKLTN